jgi:hypothetical protein
MHSAHAFSPSPLPPILFSLFLSPPLPQTFQCKHGAFAYEYPVEEDGTSKSRYFHVISKAMALELEQEKREAAEAEAEAEAAAAAAAETES